MTMEVKEIQAKSILTPCGIPGIDWVINPYIGCRFGCTYCYASFMGRFVDKNVAEWGNYVFAKINAPELLEKELPKKLGKSRGAGKEIFLSSVTDPYQGVEAKYQLTRRCLQALVDFGFAGTTSVLTKSTLVTRDIDLLKKLYAIVGLTVTSTDDAISRYFEKYAPPASERLKTLKELHTAGIKTYVFIGPLLPHFVAKPEALESLFKRIAETGTRDIFIEHLNLAPYIRKRLISEMKDAPKDVLEKFYSSQSKEYRKELETIINRLITKYDMHLLLDMVIFHKEFQTRHRDAARIDEVVK